MARKSGFEDRGTGPGVVGETRGTWGTRHAATATWGEVMRGLRKRPWDQR